MNFKKGFTLIELLVVVLIIGILGAIALPKYFFAVEKSRAVEGISIAKHVGEAMAEYNMTTGGVTSNMDDLVVTMGEKKYFTSSLGTDGNNFYVQISRIGGDYGILQFVISANPIYKDRIFCMGYTDKGKKVCSAVGSDDSCTYGATPCSYIK